MKKLKPKLSEYINHGTDEEMVEFSLIQLINLV